LLVLERIHATALEAPDKLALSHNARSLGYGAWWRLIMARRAQLQGAIPGTGLVLIGVTSLLEGWALSLAARSLGFHTAAVRDTEQFDLFTGMDVAAIVAVEGEGWEAVPGFARVKRLSLAPLALEASAEPAPLPAFPRMPRTGGHVLLTSGTTGRPKKVLSRCGESAATTSVIGNGVVMPWTSAVSCLFDLGLWTGAGYWTPLWIWAGQGAVVLRQGEDFHRALEWPGLTHAVATPQYLTRLLALPEDSFPHHPDMMLTVTAGSVTAAMAAQTRRRISPLLNINLSSTEVGGWARVFVAGDEDLIWLRIDPGRIVEVVDDADQPLPPFQLGRVRLRLQPGAEAGYFGPEEVSARVFEGEWFYPGDMGELDGKGRVALHGRATDVINIGGAKLAVEPWERAIRDRLGCDEVCILSGRWGDGVERLHLFIERRGPIGQAELEATVRDVVWGFDGVHIHKVEALPRTPLGKVQRAELARQLHDGVFGPDGGTLA
jgi:acyl-coenzyme A synthetase/AMP-(fatty) acid ligase